MPDPTRLESFKGSSFWIDHLLVNSFEKLRIWKNPRIDEPAGGAFNYREYVTVAYPQNSTEILTVRPIGCTETVGWKLDQFRTPALPANRTVAEPNRPRT